MSIIYVIKGHQSTVTLLFVGMVVLAPEVDGIVVQRRCSPITLDLFGQARESLIDIFAALGAYLQEEHVMSFCHFPSLFFLDLPLMLQITLGGNQYLANVFSSIALDLLNPAGNILEGLFVVDRIGKDDASCSFVICLSDIPKSFLTCSIPNL